jgi:hypothetical protein
MLKKINLGLVALVLGFGLIFTTSAFTAKFNHNWAFTPSSANDIYDGDAYVLNGTASDLCTTAQPLPCVISVPDDVTTNAELSTFLAGKTVSQIQAISTGRTPEQ